MLIRRLISIAGVLPTELQLACDPELDVNVELELAIEVFVSELSVLVRTYFSGGEGATGETGGDETLELSTESLSSPLSSSVVWLR